MTIQASAVINLVRDSIPDPTYAADGTPQPSTDGGLFRAQTLYRFLNDGIKALATKIGWTLEDWTALPVSEHVPTYDVNGQWHSFDEVFVNGWRMGRAAEGYLLWPQKVESGQSVCYALHSTTDHWTVRLFPAPNYTDPAYTTTGAVAVDATTISVALTTGFLPYGFVKIENELIQYYNVATDLFVSGCVRGVGGTTAATHAIGVPVTHCSTWVKGVRTPKEIVVATDPIEMPAAFQSLLQVYVLARCRQSENEFGEAARLMQEFNQECEQRKNDPRLKDNQGTQIRAYGNPVFGSLAWGKAVVS